MARSLDIDTSEINVPANGTGDIPIERTVVVDGEANNASITVYSANGDWFDYEVERDCDSVKILIKVRRNLSTDIRLGTLAIEHNCSLKQVKYIEIIQDGIEYSLDAEYVTDWVFESVPKELFEEKKIKLTATNGRGRWYLKEIQQYQTLSDDNFNDITFKYDETKDSMLSQVRVPYDGVFNCRVDEEDKDCFVIKSYGQIDLVPKDKGHMRYFFVFQHMDVNNANKGLLNENDITYEKKLLFVFNRNDMESGYKD